MKQRLRKLLGTFALLALVLVWALLAMALAQGRLHELPAVAQFVAYAALGLGWALPAGALIWWMSRPDPEPD